MTRLMVDLPEPLQRFVQEQIASGAYPDASALVQEALHQARLRSVADAKRSTEVWADIQQGVDELDRGEGIVIGDLDAFFNQIDLEVRANSAEKAA